MSSLLIVDDLNNLYTKNPVTPLRLNIDDAYTHAVVFTYLFYRVQILLVKFMTSCFLFEGIFPRSGHFSYSPFGVIH
jgi:hypothetical protein